MEITTPFVIKTTPHTKDPEAAGQNPCPVRTIVPVRMFGRAQ